MGWHTLELLKSVSRVVKKKSDDIPEPQQPIVHRLDVRDTDFLLRLIKRSNFEGTEIEQAYAVITKLGKMHRSNLES